MSDPNEGPDDIRGVSLDRYEMNISLPADQYENLGVAITVVMEALDDSAEFRGELPEVTQAQLVEHGEQNTTDTQHNHE